MWVADLKSSAGVPDLGRIQPGELQEAALKILPVSERKRPSHSVSIQKPQQTPGFWPPSLRLFASSLCRDQKPALCFSASHRTLPRPTHLPALPQMLSLFSTPLTVVPHLISTSVPELCWVSTCGHLLSVLFPAQATLSLDR